MAQAYPHFHIVLLADDYGEELWPLARAKAPACLAPLEAGSSESLLSAAVKRTRPFTASPLHVVTSEELSQVVYGDLVSRGGLGDDEIDLVSVPYAHGSAFSVALACACIRRSDPDAVVMAVPANQSVEVDDRWENLVYRAYQAALRDRIVLLGASQEDRAAGVGYIRTGRQFENIDGSYDVKGLVYEAALPAAKRAVHEGALWYTGMFVARAAVLLGSFGGAEAGGKERLGSERIAETAQFFSLLDRESWKREEATTFIEAIPSESIEEAALARSERLVAIPVSSQVSMLSSLADVDTTMEPDRSSNRGRGRAVHVGSSDVTVYEQGESSRLVCTYGVEGLLVVDTPDVVLVSDKRLLRDMSPLRDALRDAGAEELEGSTRRSFPWGSASLVSSDSDCVIWRLELRPGAFAEPLSVPGAFGVPLSALASRAASESEGGVEPSALRLHCLVTSGSVMVDGSVEGPDLAVAGDAFELASDDSEEGEPSLLCDEGAPAVIVFAVTRSKGW